MYIWLILKIQHFSLDLLDYHQLLRLYAYAPNVKGRYTLKPFPVKFTRAPRPPPDWLTIFYLTTASPQGAIQKIKSIYW